MKLYKIAVVTYARYLPYYNFIIDEAKQSRELEEVPVTAQKAQILGYFRKGKQPPGHKISGNQGDVFYTVFCFCMLCCAGKKG